MIRRGRGRGGGERERGRRNRVNGSKKTELIGPSATSAMEAMSKTMLTTHKTPKETIS